MTSPRPLLLLALAACAGAPDPTEPPIGPPDAAIEKQYEDQAAREARSRELPAILLTLDQAMGSYAAAMAQKGIPTADRQAASLDRVVRKLVREHYAQLKATAADSSTPANQGIALAALGFAEGKEVMPILLSGAQSQDPFLVDRAVFGLAILRDPDTPPGVLAAIVENKDHGVEGRAQAAWALYRLQPASPQAEQIVNLWTALLQRPRVELPEGVALQAIRGLGLTRKPDHADLVAAYADHPTPFVRMAVAVALSRMNAQAHVEALLRMLGPAESNPNVRLAAKLALEALAGGVSRGYEVDEWRKVFQRGD